MDEDPPSTPEPVKDRPGGLERRLVRSHLLVACMGLAVILVALFVSIWIQRAANRLVRERAPSAEALSRVESGVLSALASLRGWMSLAEDDFRVERRNAWDREIYPALNRLEGIVERAGTSDEFDLAGRLDRLRNRLHQLEQWQWHIEDVAQTPGNLPASDLLQSRVEPLYQELYRTISLLIEIEGSAVDGAQSGSLLWLANFRGNLSHAQSMLNLYVAEDSPHQEQALEGYLQEVTASLDALGGRAGSFNAEQQELLGYLDLEFPAYLLLANETIRRRNAPDWNLAQTWLRDRALPAAHDVTAMVKEIAKIENRRTRSDARLVARVGTFSPLALFGLLLLMLAGSLWLAHRGALRTLEPIRALADGSRELAEGTLRRDIPVNSDDELGLLSRSFNRMRRSLQQEQESLREAEAATRAIIDTATDGIVTIDERGKVLSFNSAAERIFGYVADEVIGRNVNMLMPSPDREQHDGYLATYLETGHARIIGKGREVTGRRRDGSEVPLYLSVGESGRGARRFTGILRDISALKAAQAELLATNRELEQQNRIKTAIAELDNHLRGERDLENLGRSVLNHLTEWLGAEAGALFVKNRQGRLEIVCAHALDGAESGGRSFSFGEGLVGQAAEEQRLLSIDNVPENYLTIGSGLGAAPPRHLLVAPILFEGETVGVLELGAFNRFSELGKSHLDMALEHAGVSLNAAMIHRELEAALSEVRGQAGALEEQTRQLKASRAELQSQQEELQVINEELEEQKEALVRSKMDLQAKNIEIREKAAQVAESSRYKSEFLANMSHELRTPLNSLLILARMLADNKKGNLTGKQVEYSEIIHRSGTDLLNLINDILDLSKVEAGRLDLQVSEVPVDDICHALERTFKPVSAERGIGFSVTLDAGLPAVIRSDETRLQQVLKNFLSNAFKFTPEGAVELHVGRPQNGLQLPGLDADKTVAFSVRDEGIGIPPDKQELIFEEFKQADGSTSRKFGGTGLGLSISRQLARLLGGTIHLDSEEGKGSTFTLLIPEAGPGEEPALEPGADPARPAGAEVRPALFDPLQVPGERLLDGDHTILIVEDDEAFARVVAGCCEDRGWQHLHAWDGRTGLDFAKRFRPAAILLDLGLPAMDGLNVLEALRRHPDTRDIPVHVMSCRDDQQRAAELGANGFLVKPLSMEELDRVFAQLEERYDRRVKHLLVVEDDPAQGRSLEALLGGNGDTEIVLVTNGEDALGQLADRAFDCLVLDLGLDGEPTGYDVLERLRSDVSLSHPPVIVYTGQDLTLEEEERLNRLAESIIIKGVRSHERLLDEATQFLHQADRDPPGARRDPAHRAQTADQQLRGRTVLLVDDDMRNVFALSSILEEQDMHVRVGRNGREGIQMLHDHPDIDLVLMDIMMPEMDGYEAIRILRGDPRYAGLPIIALTAKAMKGDRDQCLEAGASDYVSKPVEPDRLLSLIRLWLQQ